MKKLMIVMVCVGLLMGCKIRGGDARGDRGHLQQG